MDAAAGRAATRGIGSFLIGLLVTSALLNSALEGRLPPRVGRIVPEKLRLLAAEAPVDLAFLGSSRYHADIDPRIVDAASLESGTPLTSFNLGVSALTVVEELRLVEWLGSLRPRPPRVVVLEPILHANAELENASTDRVVAAHDLAATWMQIEYVASTDAGLRRKVRFAALHLLSFGYDFMNAGKVPRLLEAAPPSTGLGGPDPRARGFGPLGTGAAEATQDPHRALMVSGEAFRMLEAIPAFDPEGPLLSTAQTAALRRGVDGIRAMGALPVFLLTPRFDWDAAGGRTVINPGPLHRFRRTHARFFADVPLLRYEEPARAPELYDPRLWYDSSHLNSVGARLFSQTLGRDLAALLGAVHGG